MRRRRHLAAEAGFTLIELLVVLAVFGLLTGLAVTGLHLASDGWQHVSRADAESEELAAVGNEFRRLISQIYPMRPDNSSRSPILFIGNPGRIDFLAPLGQRFGAEDIVPYALHFGNDDTLRISWRLDRQPPPGGPVDVAPAIEDVVAGISQGSFSYFGPTTDGGEPVWSPIWKEQRTLPLLVRARFNWHDHPQELTAAPS